jgi:hypothetical protein
MRDKIGHTKGTVRRRIDNEDEGFQNFQSTCFMNYMQRGHKRFLFILEELQIEIYYL